MLDYSYHFLHYISVPILTNLCSGSMCNYVLLPNKPSIHSFYGRIIFVCHALWARKFGCHQIHNIAVSNQKVHRFAIGRLNISPWHRIHTIVNYESKPHKYIVIIIICTYFMLFYLRDALGNYYCSLFICKSITTNKFSTICLPIKKNENCINRVPSLDPWRNNRFCRI